MTDWAKLTAGLEHALTLDGRAAQAFLEATVEGDETLGLARRLLARAKAGVGFMQTAGEGDDAQGAIPTADILAEGSRIDVWELQSLVGQGGMGQVYRARRADGLYEQTVALKVISRQSRTGDARFENERRRLAQLEHPGIARIVDGGVTPDGRGYMAMEFVDGRPIDRHASEGGLGREAKLSLFERLCDAVSHAHARLILHRDIKPDNVLVDGSGQVRLIDFGIASELGEEDQQGPALTISSAAPEQLKGEPVSVQTDVFALGVLLHRLLTGAFPQRQANGGMEPDAARLNHRDLQAILGHCLAALPGERYASVDALRDDILAVLERRPVDARQGGQVYRVGKFFSRYPLASALGGVAIAALVAGLVASLNFADRAQQEAARAEAALTQAQWQFGRTEATLAAQQAYSDVLQRTFGSGEDVDRLSNLMIERWQEAFDARESDPKTAAALSYAVGRNFYFRGDTVRALSIFDPWMVERIGPPELVSLGEEVYAMMLSDAGRTVEATEIFRRLVNFYGDGARTSEADASNYANRLARLTRTPEDVAHATRLLEARLGRLEDPFERLFAFAGLGNMRALQADFDAALDAYTSAMEIMDANPGFATYGRDILRFNMASYLLSWSDDLAQADSLVDAILTEDVPLRGESVQLARALTVRAMIRSEQGDHDTAVSGMRDAVSLFARFSGDNSTLHLVSQGILACLLERAGAAAEAAETLEAAEIGLVSAAGNHRADIQLRLLSIYRSAHAGEIAQDDTDWLGQPDVWSEVASNGLILHFYRKLAEKGHAPRFWEQAAR